MTTILRTLVPLVFWLVFCQPMFAQDIHRFLLLDADSKLPISNVGVYQVDYNNIALGIKFSDDDGQVNFGLDNRVKGYRFSHVSYYEDDIDARDLEPGKLTVVYLYTKTVELSEIKIVSRKTGIKVSGDTTIYHGPHFVVETDKSMMDVLKGIPGISVELDGSVFYKGKSVNDFRLEGNTMSPADFYFWINQIGKQHLEKINVITHQESEADDEIIILDLKIPESSKRKPVGTLSAKQGLKDKRNINLAPIIFFDKSSIAIKALNNSVNIDYQSFDSDLVQDLLMSGRNENFISTGNQATYLHLPINGVDANNQFLVSTDISLKKIKNSTAAIKFQHYGSKKNLFSELDYYFFENNERFNQQIVNSSKLNLTNAEVLLLNENSKHKWMLKVPVTFVSSKHTTSFDNEPTGLEHSETFNERWKINPFLTSNYLISDRFRLYSEGGMSLVDQNLKFGGILPDFNNNEFHAYQYAYHHKKYHLSTKLYYTFKSWMIGVQWYGRVWEESFKKVESWATFKNLKSTPGLSISYEADGNSVNAGLDIDAYNQSITDRISSKNNFIYPHLAVRKKFNNYHTAFASYKRNYSLYGYEKGDTSIVMVNKIFRYRGLLGLDAYSLMDIYRGGYIYFKPELGYIAYNFSWLKTINPLHTSNENLPHENLFHWELGDLSNNLTQKLQYRTKLVKNLVFMDLKSNMNVTFFNNEPSMSKRIMIISNSLNFETRFKKKFNYTVGYQHNHSSLLFKGYQSKFITHTGILGFLISFESIRIELANKISKTSFQSQQLYLTNLNAKIQYTLPRKAGSINFEAFDYTNLHGRYFRVLDIKFNYELAESYTTYPGYFTLGYEIIL